MAGPKVSRVQLQTGDDSGSSYKDNKDGTIHVTHYAGSVRESYDVKYGKDADNTANSVGGTYHVTKND
ncbi:MAG: hypothetical protein AB9915_02540 [Candidatus Dojkabacteria bacterium]